MINEDDTERIKKIVDSFRELVSLEILEDLGVDTKNRTMEALKSSPKFQKNNFYENSSQKSSWNPFTRSTTKPRISDEKIITYMKNKQTDGIIRVIKEKFNVKSLGEIDTLSFSREVKIPVRGSTADQYEEEEISISYKAFITTIKNFALAKLSEKEYGMKLNPKDFDPISRWSFCIFKNYLKECKVTIDTVESKMYDPEVENRNRREEELEEMVATRRLATNLAFSSY